MPRDAALESNAERGVSRADRVATTAQGETMRQLTTALLGFAAFAGGPGAAFAECLTDCNDAYEEAMAACQAKFSGDDVQLQACSDEAHAELVECEGRCDAPD
jgi:hypothetical protein